MDISLTNSHRFCQPRIPKSLMLLVRERKELNILPSLVTVVADLHSLLTVSTEYKTVLAHDIQHDSSATEIQLCPRSHARISIILFLMY